VFTSMDVSNGVHQVKIDLILVDEAVHTAAQ
jgi:hypothetical protein